MRTQLNDNDPEDRWREAESHFHTALQLERRTSSFSHLFPEIYYQLVRLAVDRSDPAEKVREQLERLHCVSRREPPWSVSNRQKSIALA